MKRRCVGSAWSAIRRSASPAATCFRTFRRRAAAARQMLDAGRPIHTEFPSRLHPGRWVEVHLYPRPGWAQQLLPRYLGTEVGRAGDRKSRVLLDSTINAMSAQVAILDENGTVLLVNRAWSEFRQGISAIAADGVGENYLSLNMLMPESCPRRGKTARRPALRPARHERRIPLHLPDADRRGGSLVSSQCRPLPYRWLEPHRGHA